jgi:hypothetical protein
MRPVSLPGDKPSAVDPFLEQLCKALGTDYHRLGTALGVPSWEIWRRIQNRNKSDDPLNDDVLWKVSELIDERLSLLMAARLEMNRLLDKSRAQKIIQSAGQMAREKKVRRR